MSKKRTWSDDYVSFGFTCVEDKNRAPRAQCLLCNVVFSNESLRPSKLKPHFLKHGGESAPGNDVDSLRRKRARFDSRGTLPNLSKRQATIEKPLLVASYQAAAMIAKCKKNHTLGENFVKPLFAQMAVTLIGEEARKIFEKVPLSNNTIRERINDMSADVKDQVVQDLKDSAFKISLQLDESTDVASCSQLIAFVRYVRAQTVREDFLFCRSIETTTTAKDVLRILEDFFRENDLDLAIIGSVCTDGAPAMLGNRSGFCTLMKKKIPGLQSTHCFLHRHALAAKTLPTDLNEVLSNCVKIVNHIRGRALNHRLFKALCESVGAEHTVLLFHTSVRWLSRGKCLGRLFELREEVRQFLDGQSMLVETLDAPMFIQRLGYLVDIFSLLNGLNVSLQGPGLNVVTARGKLNAFIEKISLWNRRVQAGNLTDFPSFEKYLSLCSNGERSVLISEISEHLGMLAGAFDGYFAPSELHTEDMWILNPFLYNCDDLSDHDTMKPDLIELRSDENLKMIHSSKSLEDFWCSIVPSYPKLSERALNVLLPFSTTYLCESGFSTLLSIKTKYRSRLNPEDDMRIAISRTEPRIDNIIAQKQEHRSH